MLSNTELWLKNKCYTEEGPYLFPFYPNPNWKTACVFIVGLNPIDPFREEFDSFDHYWQALTQHPETFEKAYQKKHLQKKGEKSRTRKRISELVQRLAPLNVLVTNVFAYPTVFPSSIPREMKQESDEEKVISHLIINCKPSAILFHGREARLFANRYFKVELDAYTNPKEQRIAAVIPGTTKLSSLFAYHHFVGRVEPHSVMEEHLKKFAEQIHLQVAQHSAVC
jgi:hypothetical protein